MIAGRKIGYPVAEFAHYSGRLMTQHHRHWARPVTIDCRQVRVAQPRGLDLDEHFTKTGRTQLNVTHLERSGYTIWALCPMRRQDRCFHVPHLKANYKPHMRLS